MKNLWQFIVNNIHLLLFILLEVVAFLLITHNEPYPQSLVLTSANHVVAQVNETGDDIASYFCLHRDNEILNEEITRLQLQIQDLQNQLEPYKEGSTLPDSSVYRYANMEYQVIPAKVIDLTTNQTHNYLTLNKGARDGLQQGMGVIANGSVVGIVDKVSYHFALVIPLIHKNINVSARIQKNGQIGFTNWQEGDANHVYLNEIGRHIPIAKGDTIVTSGLTTTFPEGLLIGVTDHVSLDNGDNYYTIHIRLNTDYNYIRYVQVIGNPMLVELDSLSYE